MSYIIFQAMHVGHKMANRFRNTVCHISANNSLFPPHIIDFDGLELVETHGHVYM